MAGCRATCGYFVKSEPQTAPPSVLPMAANKNDEPLRVLVVDDMASSRAVLVQLVHELGHSTLEAASGAAALDLIASQDPDLVLVDLLMPDMHGYETAQAVRRQVSGRWLPVIVLSSLAGDEYLEQALSAGAADYLVKPVRPAILRAKLRQYQRILYMQSSMAALAQRQAAIHEHMADGIVTTDDAGRVLEINRAARQWLAVPVAAGAEQRIEALTGLTVDQLRGRSEFELNQAGQDVLVLGVGHSVWRLGHQNYTTFSLHDLSEYRRMERMKEEFLATVSHELRTPLTSIVGALGLMAAGAAGALPATAQQLALVAQRNGERLSQLIDDVLDLTKLEGDRMNLALRPADVLALVREALAANQAYADKHGVSLQLQAPPELGQVVVDPDRMLQVLANLLSNAVKHSPAGGRVHLEVGLAGPWLRLSVADQGPGIDPAFRARLFEKFAQADTSDKRRVAGTGLGLYITRMLVERMGGSIQAGSGSSGGAVFTVQLRRVQDQHKHSWLLCVASDVQLLARLSEWLAPLAEVETARDLAAARVLVQRRGPATLVLGNPQSQGAADVFCQGLRGLAAAGRSALCGATVDAGFAERQGLGWVALQSSQQDTLAQVAALMGEGQMRGNDGQL